MGYQCMEPCLECGFQSLLALNRDAAQCVHLRKPILPNVGQAYPDSVYWGDTHVHTALSVDGYIFGNRLMPDDAYRFRQG